MREESNVLLIYHEVQEKKMGRTFKLVDDQLCPWFLALQVSHKRARNLLLLVWLLMV
ncbi:unnamed protein product [Brassica rapa subsp. narinosa]